jgi:2-polyprenyl-3-methyl-5-hydroxy-6-metoxy-1,4-benzoquinol methylase
VQHGYEERECPVCGGTQGIPGYAVHYESRALLEELGLRGVPPRVRLKRCPTCSHHFASPHIAKPLLTRYYSELRSEFYSDADPLLDSRARQHAAVVAEVERLVPGGRVLDIGYGHGFLLSHFNPDRWTRLGVEPSPDGSQAARKRGSVDRHWDSLEEISGQSGTVDVVLIMDVVEHLADVRSMLQRARQIIAPDGLLVIGTGNIDSMNARLSRGWWGYFRSWEHVSFFSPESIRWALRGAGFSPTTVVRCRHAGGWPTDVANFMQSMRTAAKNAAKIALLSVAGISLPTRNGALVHDHLLAFARPSEPSKWR